MWLAAYALYSENIFALSLKIGIVLWQDAGEFSGYRDSRVAGMHVTCLLTEDNRRP